MLLLHHSLPLSRVLLRSQPVDAAYPPPNKETIKLRYINREPDKPPGFEYSHFSSLLENIYSARVDTFPLNRTWRTEGSELKLTI